MTTPSREQVEQWAREADECAVREAEKRHLSSRTWYDIRDEHFARLVRALEEAKKIAEDAAQDYMDSSDIEMSVAASSLAQSITALIEKVTAAMSDTPKTDARSAWLIGHAVVPEWLSRGGEQECVDADFARRLERERDAARAERDEAVKQMEAGWIRVCKTSIADVVKENDALRAALEECERVLCSAGCTMTADRARAILDGKKS